MTDELKADEPDLRADAFHDELGVPREEYREALNEAVRNALEAPRDPFAAPWVAWGARNIGGRMRALVQHPTRPAIMYAGSAQGGVYRSDDHGDTWVPLGDAHDAFPVGALALAGEPNPDILYIGSGEPGVKHSPTEPPKEQFPGGLGFFRYDASRTPPRMVAEARNVKSGGVLPAGAANGYAQIVADPGDRERCWIASSSGLWRRERGPVFISEPLPVGGRVEDNRARFEPPLPAGTRYRRLRGGQEARVAATTIRSTAASDQVTGSGFRAFLSVGDVIETLGLPVNQARVVLEVVSDTSIRVGYRSAPVTDVALSTDSRGTYRILAAVGAQGVYRGVFKTAHVATLWKPERLEGGLPEPLGSGGDDTDRIRLAVSRSRPAHVYALYEKRRQRKIQALFHSSDGGDSWTRRELDVDLGGQAWFNLVCSVHPDNPALVVVGAVELARSKDFGKSWEKILNRDRSNKGDPAQHLDQHVAHFDLADPRRLWVANDGGIAETSDIVDGNPDTDGTWRKRSHGIVGAQFNDITVHPNYPSVMGGGLQDNGTYAGIGGETWFHRGDGDGGLISWRPNNPRDFIFTTQWEKGEPQISRSRVVPGDTSPLLRSQVNGDLERPLDIFASEVSRLDDEDPIVSKEGPFVGKVVGHPGGSDAEPHHFLVGRKGAVFFTNDGRKPLLDAGIPNAAPAPANQRLAADVMVTALAHDESVALGSIADWWVGTDHGHLFRRVHNGTAPAGTVEVGAANRDRVIGDGATNFAAVLVPGDGIVVDPGGPNEQQGLVREVTAPHTVNLVSRLTNPVNAGATWRREQWSNLAPSGLRDHRVTRIAVNPRGNSYVVVATAGEEEKSDQGRVLLSIDRGMSWVDVSGLPPPPAGPPALAGAPAPGAPAGTAPPAQSLPAGPVTGLVFDPSPARGDPQVLYASTLAGVYVIRNLPPANAAAMPAFQPRWFAFNGRPVTPDRFDPVIPGGTAFKRIRGGVATTGADSIESDALSPVVVGSDTRFATFFQAGDVIRTDGLDRNQERIVERVIGDTRLLTRSRSAPADAYTPALPAATGYSIQPAAGGASVNGAGTISSAGADVTGSGTSFRSDVEIGDVLHSRLAASGDQARVVVSVKNNEHLTVAMKGRAADRFSPALPAGTVYAKDLHGVVGSTPGAGTVACSGTDVTGTGTTLNTLFGAGDTIHVTPAGGGPTQVRQVATVPSATRMTVTEAFNPAIPAGAGYAQSDGRTGTVACNARQVTGIGTDFHVAFRPGDVIQVTPAGGGATQARIVAVVVSDTELEVMAPFNPNVAAGADYTRSGAGLGSIATTAESNVVTGRDTAFTTFFQPGDVLRAGGQDRIVEAVENDTLLRTAALPPPGHPLVLVNDLTIATHPPAAGAPTGTPASVARHRLLTATYGRGIFNTDLTAQPAGDPRGGPRQRLYVRQYSVEDGLDYPRPAPALLNSRDNPSPGHYRMRGDPRVPRGQIPFSLELGFDIRVDNAPFQFFEEVVDGVDFDEALRTKPLVPGRTNFVYVQAHNRGWDLAHDARAHLYFAPAPAVTPDGFDPPLAGAAFNVQPPVDSPSHPGMGNVTSVGDLVNGADGTVFMDEFSRGTLIVAGGQTRMVAEVFSHTQLRTRAAARPDAFDPSLAAAPYQRVAAAGGGPTNLLGDVTSGARNILTGANGTSFRNDFQPGDLIVAGGQSRIVAEVLSDTDLRTAAVPLPDLHADFWAQHLEDPLPAPAAAPVAPAAAWRRAGSAVRLRPLGPNRPAVARFDWVPPASLAGSPVALFAVVTSAHDPLPANPPTELWRLLLQERRVACRVVRTRAFVPDFYIRDGNEDDGRHGSVAYGGRSPDIIVQRNAVPAPDRRDQFRNLTDPRLGQELEAGQNEHIFVRVFNRLEVEAEVEVEVLWTKTNVPTSDPDASAPPFEPAKWQAITGVSTDRITVPPEGWAVAQLRWDNVPDPDNDPQGLRAVTLIALLRSTAAGDPRPTQAVIHDDPEAFWRFFMDQAAANNAAMRVVRVKV